MLDAQCHTVLQDKLNNDLLIEIVNTKLHLDTYTLAQRNANIVNLASDLDWKIHFKGYPLLVRHSHLQ